MATANSRHCNLRGRKSLCSWDLNQPKRRRPKHTEAQSKAILHSREQATAPLLCSSKLMNWTIHRAYRGCAGGAQIDSCRPCHETESTCTPVKVLAARSCILSIWPEH